MTQFFLSFQHWLEPKCFVVLVTLSFLVSLLFSEHTHTLAMLLLICHLADLYCWKFQLNSKCIICLLSVLYLPPPGSCKKFHFLCPFLLNPNKIVFKLPSESILIFLLNKSKNPEIEPTTPVPCCRTTWPPQNLQ